MISPLVGPRPAGPRDLFFFTHPEHWPSWPFLPVVRRHTNGEMDCGLLYDAMHVTGRTGYSATVFLCNLFAMPQTEAEFLALPREVFDSADEMAAAGWRVDRSRAPPTNRHSSAPFTLWRGLSRSNGFARSSITSSTGSR